MFAELRELLRSGAIHRHQLEAKGILIITLYKFKIWRKLWKR